MVSVLEVRAILGNIDNSILPDESIASAIESAKSFVSTQISTSNSMYDECVKWYAAFLSIIIYTEIGIRTMGSIPSDTKPELYLDVFRQLLDAARTLDETNSSSTMGPGYSTTESWYDYVDSYQSDP